MTYLAERTRGTLKILHAADKIVRAVEKAPKRAAIFQDLDRDIYAETIAATGIDPELP